MIEFSNVTYFYDSNKNVLKDISLIINEGEFVAILGRNGCGKSTLVRQLNALLVPQEGMVLVDNLDTKDDNNVDVIRNKVGMVFQNPDNQIVSSIVEEDVAFAPENLGIPTEKIQSRVEEALEIVGMSEYAKHAPHLLSGGQKQRVAIAGVLAMKPKYLVLDEPTAMLDPKGRKDIMKTLVDINLKDVTVIIVTHNMDEAALADRMIVMNDGTIDMDGSPKEIFKQPERLTELGLDLPQSCEIVRQLGLAPVLNLQEAYDEIKERISNRSEKY